MGTEEHTSSLPPSPPWTVSVLSHQPDPPDFRQVRHLSPQLRPGEFHHDVRHDVHLHSGGKTPVFYTESHRTSSTTDIFLSPPLLPIALPSKELHEDFSLPTIWKKEGYYRPGSLEKSGHERSSEYMNVITMFPSSCEDALADYSVGQFQHQTSNLGTQRTSLRLQSGLPGRLRSDIRRPPSIHLPGGLPLASLRPRTRIQTGGPPRVSISIQGETGGPSRFSPALQGVSGSRLTLMDNCRITKISSASAMAKLVNPSVSIWNEFKIVVDHDMYEEDHRNVYMKRVYGSRWVQTQMFIAGDQMMRLPVQSVLPGR